MIKNFVKGIEDRFSVILSWIANTSVAFKIILSLSVTIQLAVIFWPWINTHHELIRNLGLVSAALVGFPMLIWRTKIADQQTQISDRQAQNSESSHIAEVYTKAIEQLGSHDGGNPNLEIRLGGVYALERIASSSKEYRQQIVEVLCAYVRLNSPIHQDQDQGQARERSNDIEQHLQIITAIVHVLSNLRIIDDIGINLQKVNLAGIHLVEADLRGADLRRADLTEADLTEADLRGAVLRRADLWGADLWGADLKRADLEGAHLERAGLTLAKLGKADLTEVDLTRACLEDAFLEGTNLMGADLKGANLRYAHLEDAHLRRANLRNADLRNAKLLRADLEGANLYKSHITKANYLDTRVKNCLLYWEVKSRDKNKRLMYWEGQ